MAEALKTFLIIYRLLLNEFRAPLSDDLLDKAPLRRHDFTNQLLRLPDRLALRQKPNFAAILQNQSDGIADF
ncbi:MAG: hypothetical protein M3367_10740 [Acidobacteriota bacterium]|nr:hypothetical protein [Acidobacteriota bacterium]